MTTASAPLRSGESTVPGEIQAFSSGLEIPASVMLERRLIAPAEWGDFEYFSREEFFCSCCGKEQMTYRYIYCLNAFRDHCGFPLNINSGWRCPEYNQKVSSTGPNGPHTTGEASDQGASFNRAWEIFENLPGPFLGVGINQSGAAPGRFFHTDLCDYLRGGQRRMWSY